MTTPEHEQYAGACGSAGQVALHRIEVTPGVAAGTFYIDDENYALGNGLWIYAETNGVWVPKLPGVYVEGNSNANLQRGDFIPLTYPNQYDICYDDAGVEPDTLIF